MRRGRFAVELRVKLAIGGNQRGGAANDKGDLVIGVPLVGEDNYTCECSYVVLNGAESVIQSASDFVGLEALEVETHSLDPVGLAGADVPLLAAAGDFDLAAAQGLNIAHDGADTAVEQAKRQVLVAEQPALLAGLGSQPQDAGAAQALDAILQAELVILLAGIEGQLDVDLLALFERLAGGLAGRDDQEPDPPEAELVIGVLGADGKNLLDSVQDRLGEEGGAVGSLFDPAPNKLSTVLAFRRPSRSVSSMTFVRIMGGTPPKRTARLVH